MSLIKPYLARWCLRNDFLHYKQRHVTIFDLTRPRNFYASLTRIVKKDTALVSFIWLQEQLKQHLLSLLYTITCFFQSKSGVYPRISLISSTSFEVKTIYSSLIKSQTILYKGGEGRQQQCLMFSLRLPWIGWFVRCL